MRPIDTDALLLVAQSLGVGNPATVVGSVEFDDGVLQQTLDVYRAVRRARGFPRNGDGVGTILLTGAIPALGGVDGVAINPYNVGFVNGGPSIQQETDLDAWLIDFRMRASGTAANFTAGTLEITGIPSINGSAQTHFLAAFDACTALGTLYQPCTVVGTGEVTPRFPPFRVPRGASIQMEVEGTDTLSVLGICVIQFTPRTLGQDAVGGY